jgi:hypothetical protein
VPLLVGSPVPLAPLPEGVEIPGNVERQGPGSITATWIDPDGIEWPLSVTDIDPGWFTTFGPAGWGSTPVELVVDPNPRGGELVRYVRAKPRRIQWPLYIGGNSHADFVTRYRSIMKAFTKTTYRRTPGALRVARPDGTSRLIDAWYEQGFEGEAGENWLWAKPVITLYCPDGYWASPDLDGLSVSFDASAGPAFLSPFFSVVSGNIVDPGGDGYTSVYNLGDVDAWPAWTLVGPFDSFSATNLTTGERFGFNLTVNAGARVVITTDPSTARLYATPEATTATNVSKFIDWFNPAGTSLWPLIAGENRIDFQVTAAGAGTALTMAWRHRWEAA